MSTCKQLSQVAAPLLLWFCAIGTCTAAAGPDLGVTVTDAEIHTENMTVLPDGTGLPPGSGDSGTGALLYRQHCLACHGERGTGGANGELAGGRGTLTSAHPLRTIGSFWPQATTLFDYVRRAMPYPTPGVLADSEVYAITAYLLHVNGIVDETTVLDSQSLPAVVMPNADGFQRVFETRPPGSRSNR